MWSTNHSTRSVLQGDVTERRRVIRSRLDYSPVTTQVKAARSWNQLSLHVCPRHTRMLNMDCRIIIIMYKSFRKSPKLTAKAWATQEFRKSELFLFLHTHTHTTCALLPLMSDRFKIRKLRV